VLKRMLWKGKQAMKLQCHQGQVTQEQDIRSPHVTLRATDPWEYLSKGWLIRATF
jgi:hypothetical protein